MDKLEPCPPTEYQIECWPPRQTGGQVAGGVQNGVRITHVASGLQAVCTDERSQHRNREIAMAMIEGGLTCPMYRGPMPTAAAPPALCQRTLEAAANMREQIARIIDPAKWSTLDAYLANMKRRYADKNVSWDEDAFRDPVSLAKAAAILALRKDDR